jgi:hypothetical protein
MHNLNLKGEMYHNDHIGLHKTPNIFKIPQMLPHPYSTPNKTYLIVIQMGLRYPKVNPI